jgi:succinoglycan biosynthesis protein ExoM
LTSLTEQQGAPPFDVIVVDNDAQHSGEGVAIRYCDRLNLRYVVEPVRGLSRVRNRAVAESRGTFLAFIDDDEWAAPQWLARLAAKAEEYFADVVAGPVTFVFDNKVPEHIRSCSLFNRPAFVDGAPLPWYRTYTSNAYVRRSALPDPVRPFASVFDLTGGEDVDLFARMIDHGALVVGAADAEVFEQRPADRANLRWVLRRAVKNGTLMAGREWSAFDTLWRISLGLRAGLHGVGLGIAGLVTWRKDPGKAIAHLIAMADNFGRLAATFRVRIYEYRHHS